MIYEIKNEGLTARIDSLGAQLISLCDREGTEYIWQRDPQVWASCSPILFPIIGNLRNGKTVIDGKIWEMPKHGPTRNVPFHLSAQSETSVTLQMSDRDFPEGAYPWAFGFSITYSLSENRLTFLVSVSNPSDGAMAYCIGLHPAVRCPLFPGEAFEDYVIRFPKPQTSGYRSYDPQKFQFDKSAEHPLPGSDREIRLNRELFSVDAMWFDRPDSREASLVNPSTGRGVRAEFPDFETVAFWTKYNSRAEYLCFEPWNGSSACSDEDDEFLHKNHIQILDGGESRDYRLTLEILRPQTHRQR